MLYCRSFLIVYFVYSSVYMLIPNSWFIPPCYLFLLVTISLFLKFVFLGYHLLLLLFHFFCLFGTFPFSSQWAWLEVCGFSLSFQKKKRKQVLVLFIFHVIFLISILFPVWSSLFPLFADFGFCFSNSFRWYIRLLISDFSCFMEFF